MSTLPPIQFAIIKVLDERGGFITDPKSAGKVIYEVLKEEGYKFDRYKSFYRSIEGLKRKKLISVQNNASESTVLLRRDITDFIGGFEAEPKRESSEVEAKKDSDIPGQKPSIITEEIRSWSITNRSQLIRELSDSIITDLEAYKGVVIDGL